MVWHGPCGGQAWDRHCLAESRALVLAVVLGGSLTGRACPCLGLSGGEGLSKLLAPPAINVLHFP